MAKSKDKMGFYMDCCMSRSGVIHILTGLGIGFLVAPYLGAGNLNMWGLILLGLGVVGHLMGKTR